MGAGEPRDGVARGLARLAAAVVVASGLAAGIAGWRYWHDTGAGPAAARPLVTARTGLDADLFRLVPDADDHRPPAPYPLDFERQFPLIAALPVANEPPTLPLPAPAHAAPKGGAARRDCTARCPTAPALALVAPPRRPEGLRAVSPAEDGLGDAVAAEGAEARMEVLGIPLPPLAPAGRAVLRRMADIGEGVGRSVTELLDAAR